MRAFEVELTPAILQSIVEHAEREYPREACGLVVGAPAGSALARVEPMRNVQDRYHKLDPVAFPRDSRDAFRLDELERMRLLERLDAEGMVERVLYHSHCDAGAYFSPEDRAMAVRDGLELLPGVVHLVISIRGGRAVDAAAFRWRQEDRGFLETRVPIGTPPAGALPDLSARAMEGREAARPIRPVGLGLVARAITAEEVGALESRAAVVLPVGEAAWREVERFALGLWSPLSGFLTAAEEESVRARQVLPSGLAWLEPVSLEVAGPVAASVGTLVALAAPGGQGRAFLSISESIQRGDRVRLAGAIYASPARSPSAAERRAELLRRAAKRVLAVPKWDPRRHASIAQEFDLVLAPGADGGQRLDFPLASDQAWANAVFAQNLGATHILVDDRSEAERIERTLAIEPLVAP
jgi:[CysO sulfur-carrier protein]-S-L-cysteine hydrolase